MPEAKKKPKTYLCKLVRGLHSHGGKTYHPGDLIESEHDLPKLHERKFAYADVQSAAEAGAAELIPEQANPEQQLEEPAAAEPQEAAKE